MQGESAGFVGVKFCLKSAQNVQLFRSLGTKFGCVASADLSIAFSFVFLNVKAFLCFFSLFEVVLSKLGQNIFLLSFARFLFSDWFSIWPMTLPFFQHAP